MKCDFCSGNTGRVLGYWNFLDYFFQTETHQVFIIHTAHTWTVVLPSKGRAGHYSLDPAEQNSAMITLIDRFSYRISGLSYTI